MSSRNRKKPQPQKKRVEVTDSSGWTHVVNGRKGAVDANDLGLQLSALHGADEIPLDEVKKNHTRYLRLWEGSECWKNLANVLEKDILSSKRTRLTNCVCLGLGSLSAGRDSSKYELAALVSILDLLGNIRLWFLKDALLIQRIGKNYAIQKVVFQDPAFNDVDEAFLNALGYSVVSTPLGLEIIDTSTFLFAPHLENNIFSTAVQHAHPALCIGNSDVLSGASLHESASDEKIMKETLRQFVEATELRPMPSFDRDTWCQFTSIYWRRGAGGGI